MHVPRVWGQGRVDVCVGVHPQHAGVGVNLQVAVQGAHRDGMVAPNGQEKAVVGDDALDFVGQLFKS